MNERRDGVWATLLTREDYLPGVRVLAQSLREASTAYPLVVMVTHDVPGGARERLERDGCEVVEVARVDPPDADRAYVFEQFSEVWTKLRAWCLDAERVVLLDADMMVLGSMDELMTMPLPDGGIAACHTCRCNPEGNEHYPADWTPAGCWFTYLTGARELPADFTGYFNSGLVVLRPGEEVFAALVERVAGADVERWPFPDQDLLNEHFRSRWAALPWGYNALKTLSRQHPDVWDLDHVHDLHYLLAKPWADGAGEAGSPYADVERLWLERSARLPG